MLYLSAGSMCERLQSVRDRTDMYVPRGWKKQKRCGGDKTKLSGGCCAVSTGEMLLSKRQRKDQILLFW